MEGCGDPRIAAWRAFARAHRVLSRALEEGLEAHVALPLLSYEVLARLAEAPGRRLRMQELAEFLPLTKSGLTRLMDRMEDEGLARRELCPTDRRGTFAALTAKGHATLERAGKVHARILEECFVRQLDEDELRVLVAAFDKIIEGR